MDTPLAPLKMDFIFLLFQNLIFVIQIRVRMAERVLRKIQLLCVRVKMNTKDPVVKVSFGLCNISITCLSHVYHTAIFILFLAYILFSFSQWKKCAIQILVEITAFATKTSRVHLVSARKVSWDSTAQVYYIPCIRFKEDIFQ